MLYSLYKTGTGDSRNQDDLRRPDQTCTFHNKPNAKPNHSIVHSVNRMERLVLIEKNPEGNLKGLHMWVPTPTHTAQSFVEHQIWLREILHKPYTIRAQNSLQGHFKYF